MKTLTNPLQLIFSCALFIVATSGINAQVKPAIPRDEKIEQQVEATLKKMSLDEKIGQMCELAIDVVTDNRSRNGFALNEDTLPAVFGKYKVGSILNVPAGIAQTPDSWSKIIRRLNDESLKATGVTEIYGVDQIHGATYTWGSTFFPQEINQASSFNREIPYRASQISAYESRACLIPWTYAPVLDLGRNAMWSRQWESYGEDVFLQAEMGKQAVRGFQGDDPNHIDGKHMAACLKHFMAYGVPVTGKDRTPSSVTDREMLEKYFEPFKKSIQAGALSLMVNSSSNNGVPFHANKQFLTDWLKVGLNWDGMIVTDWADINNLYTRDHVAANKKEAIEMAINAGIDMSMEPYNVDFCKYLKQSVQEGKVKMERIDDAVRRILRLKYRLGLMDRKTWDIDSDKLSKQFPDFGSKKFDEEAIRMAEECIVLLKNQNNVLPIKQGTKILVTGPNADTFRAMTGGWSYSWQGDRADEACRKIGKYHTFYEAIRNKFGENNVKLVSGVTYAGGSDWQRENRPDIQSAVDAAKDVDIIIACIGENSYCETPGNMDDLNISPNQQQLVKELAATGKPIVMVLNEGRPRVINTIEPLAKATIDAMLPSNYGGDALANLLAGDANFSARLPYTYPKTVSSLITYDYKMSESVGTMSGAYNYNAHANALYMFGHGLSYTTFSYSNLKADKTSFTADDEITFTVDVKNTGNVDGKEAVLLYVKDVTASLMPDNRRLRGFDKISLKAGETKTVSIKIKGGDLAFVGLDNHWILEEGAFVAMIGNQSVNLNCTKTKRWDSMFDK